jgi:hypothetical protein
MPKWRPNTCTEFELTGEVISVEELRALFNIPAESALDRGYVYVIGPDGEIYAHQQFLRHPKQSTVAFYHWDSHGHWKVVGYLDWQNDLCLLPFST